MPGEELPQDPDLGGPKVPLQQKWQILLYIFIYIYIFLYFFMEQKRNFLRIWGVYTSFCYV